MGKSSLLNRLAGDTRAVVHDVAGTTVDPVDEVVNINGMDWLFVDTAGIRRRVRQASGHEFYASIRTQAAIERAEVAVMVLDSSESVSEQDQRILTMIVEAGRALVLAFNKWDLVDDERRYYLEREFERDLHQVAWAPRVNVSGTDRSTGRPAHRSPGHGTGGLVHPHRYGATQRLHEGTGGGPSHPVRGGKQPRVLFATQASTQPPTFVLFTTGFIEAGYRRFVERRLREGVRFRGDTDPDQPAGPYPQALMSRLAVRESFDVPIDEVGGLCTVSLERVEHVVVVGDRDTTIGWAPWEQGRPGEWRTLTVSDLADCPGGCGPVRGSGNFWRGPDRHPGRGAGTPHGSRLGGASVCRMVASGCHRRSTPGETLGCRRELPRRGSSPGTRRPSVGREGEGPGPHRGVRAGRCGGRRAVDRFAQRVGTSPWSGPRDHSLVVQAWSPLGGAPADISDATVWDGSVWVLSDQDRLVARLEQGADAWLADTFRWTRHRQTRGVGRHRRRFGAHRDGLPRPHRGPGQGRSAPADPVALARARVGYPFPGTTGCGAAW